MQTAPLPCPPVPRALACAVALAWCGLPLSVLAQADAATPSAWDAPPALRSSPLLQEKIPDAVRPQLPVFVTGDRISGQTDLNTLIEGHAELRRGDTIIRADRLDYNVPEDLAKARGQVRINRAGNVYEGTALELRVDAFEGFFSDARYRFLATQAHGESTRVDFIDKDRSVVHNATYTTCERDNTDSWQPDWVLRAGTIHIDNEEEVGSAEDAVLEFKGVPLLAVQNRRTPTPGTSRPPTCCCSGKKPRNPACCPPTTRRCCAASWRCSPTGTLPSTAASRWMTSNRPP